MNRPAINYFKATMLFAAPAAFFGAVGYAIGGSRGLLLCAAAWISFAAILFWAADRVVFKQHSAEYLPESHAPGLYALVSELARRARIPRPALYLLRDAAPNMLVTGTRPNRGAIGLSKGLLELLSTEELAAVVAHALHHLRSAETVPMTLAAGLVRGLISVSNVFRWSNLLSTRSLSATPPGGIPSDAFLWVLIAPIAAALVRATVYQSRQFRADAASAHCIGDANPLCTALTKLEARMNQEDSVATSPATAHLFLSTPLTRNQMALFRTHPPTAERLHRLEELGRVIHFFARVMKLGPANE